MFIVEDRYALATEVQEYKNEQANTVKNLGISLEKTRVEDKLFELELKDPVSRSQIDKALIQRYQRKLY